MLRGEVFQRQVPGQLFHQREASVSTLGPHGQGECVRHRWSQVWSCSPHSSMAQARRLQNWYCMFKMVYFSHFRLKPVNIFIFTGQELSVHIAPHECLGEDQWTENSGLVKMNSFKRCYQLNALFKIKSGFIRSWRTNLNQNLFHNPHSTCINNYIAIYHVISYK